EIIRRAAIYQEVVEIAAPAIYRHLYGSGPRLDCFFGQLPDVHHPDLERGQLEQVAAVQRQVLDRSLRNHRRNLWRPGVDQRSVAGDHDLVSDRSHLQIEVHHGVAPNGEHETAVYRLGESLPFRENLVFAQRQLGDQEPAAVIAGRGARDVSLDVPGRDV